MTGRKTRVVLVIGALALAGDARADPVTSTTPNIDTPEVVAPRVFDFLFMHRFDAVAGKVLNSPTFFFNLGIVDRLSVGVVYATSSNVGIGPNEEQPIVRFAALQQSRAAPLDLTAELAYNFQAESVDGALVGARRFGPLSLLATARGFSDTYRFGGTGFAGGLGGTLQLTRYFFLVGDVNYLVAVEHASRLAPVPPVHHPGWSGGIAFKIPYTPHAFSFYATNVNTATLQGSSRGTETIRYGFAFDVPFTDLDRWIAIFHPKPAQAPAAPAAPTAQPAVPGGPAGPGRVVEVAIQGNAYHPEEVSIRPGDTVRWVNRDPVQHTATDRGGKWTSPLLEQEQKFEHRFDAPGRFDYTCTVHPFMHGAVVVRE
jgi:plastocyanin